NPGNIDIVRSIVTPTAAQIAGNIDTAVFSGLAVEYDITTNPNGSLRVAHVGGTAADGVDTLWNIEVLAFADVSLRLTGGVAIVPSVVGLSQAAASAAITSANLRIGTVQVVTSNAPSGTVITQTPVGGQGVVASSFVSLIVSTGPPLVAI